MSFGYIQIVYIVSTARTPGNSPYTFLMKHRKQTYCDHLLKPPESPLVYMRPCSYHCPCQVETSGETLRKWPTPMTRRQTRGPTLFTQEFSQWYSSIHTDEVPLISKGGWGHTCHSNSNALRQY
jgi:hypothetical protein